MGVKNRRIYFLAKSTVRDAIGQEKTEWVLSDHSALAEISPVSGRLYFEAAKNNEENTKLFRCRYSSWMNDLNTADYRIRYNGTDYKIRQFANIKEHNRTVEFRGVSVFDKVSE